MFSARGFQDRCLKPLGHLSKLTDNSHKYLMTYPENRCKCDAYCAVAIAACSGVK